MLVNQIYELVNNATKEAIGDVAILQEDLGNIVDVGTAIFDASAVDGYVKSLINQVGRMIFVNRKYALTTPSVMRDAWEFGSILEKITSEMPIAEENESWQLEGGQTYEQNIFYKPTVTAKFFNKRTTFEIPQSITERQVKQSFQNAVQLTAFISMLYNEVEKSITVKDDEIIRRTINNFIAETLYTSYSGSGYSASSKVKAVNLLYLYNQEYGASLTKDKCLSNKDFIRFATYIMSNYMSRMSRMSELFNMEGKQRFTPKEMLHFITLSDFENASKIFLQSDTFNKDLVALPMHEVVPYWQGSGTDFAFGNISKINVTTTNDHNLEIDGVLAVMFDHDALGVSNLDRRVTTHYNAKAEFFNNWHKVDAGYWNDFAENFVVFFVQ